MRRATALCAAQAGANISVDFRQNRAASEAVVAGIQSVGRRAVAVEVDMTMDGEAARALDKATRVLGPLSGVVVSAGIVEGLPLEEMTLEFWECTLSYNLHSTFLSVQAAAPHLQKNGSGSIVIYASTAGQRGSAVYSAYATSKGG